MLDSMIEATYRILRFGSEFKVEINRPGEIVQFAHGFTSEAAAKVWIEEDRHIANIDEGRRSSGPPKLRVV